MVDPLEGPQVPHLVALAMEAVEPDTVNADQVDIQTVAGKLIMEIDAQM